MDTPKFVIKYFRLPVEFREPLNDEESTNKVLDYSPVEMKDHFQKEEEVDLTPLSDPEDPVSVGEFIKKIAVEIQTFNRAQLNMAKLDSTITIVTKKVLCKND